jgi:uncharacterized protein YndB with AHSA1/START domain
MTPENQSVKKEGLKIVREFKAPKTLVFEAFSTSDSLAQWWGPPGMPITVEGFDFKEGGIFHYKMEGHGQVMWGIFNYGKINRPDSIEFVSSFSDEKGNICKSPFPMDFPLQIFNKLILEEKNGNTLLTLTGHPINATPEQEATYYSMIKNMEEGFGGTMNQLEQYLLKIQK